MSQYLWSALAPVAIAFLSLVDLSLCSAQDPPGEFLRHLWGARDPLEEGIRQRYIEPCRRVMETTGELQKKVLKALDSEIAVDFNKITLQAALEQLEEKAPRVLRTIVDEQSLKDSGLTADSPVTLKQKGTMGDILRKLLADRGLTYVVRDGLIFVVTPARIGSVPASGWRASSSVVAAQVPGWRDFDPNPKAVAKEVKHWNELLGTPLDVKNFRPRTTVKEALGQLAEQLAKRNIELRILVDVEAFGKMKTKFGVYETPANLSSLGPRATVTELLREMLRQIPDVAATCYVDIGSSFLEITVKGTDLSNNPGLRPIHRLLWELPTPPSQRIGDEAPLYLPTSGNVADDRFPGRFLPWQKENLSIREIEKMLERQIETKDFQQPLPLALVLDWLHRKLADKDQKKCTFTVDREAFKKEDPDAPNVMETTVKFPPYPKRLSLHTAFRLTLSKMQSGSATLRIRRGLVEITTYDQARDYPILDQTVSGAYKDQPLSKVLADFAEITGVSIVVDCRVQKQAEKRMTAEVDPILWTSGWGFEERGNPILLRPSRTKSLKESPR